MTHGKPPDVPRDVISGSRPVHPRPSTAGEANRLSIWLDREEEDAFGR